jgi:polysaccharide export outer membrane protein
MSKKYFTMQRAAAMLLGGLLLFLPGARAQSGSEAAPKASGSGTAPEDYKIGSGDVLAVSVTNAPEFGGKFRVTDTGVIEIPGVPRAIRAEDRSPVELAHVIREAFMEAKQLRDPLVSVYVDEFHGRTVTVLGAVAKPSVYPIVKRTNVLEALSLAGGALPNSGNTVTIVKGSASAEATDTTAGSVQILRMSDLMSGKEASTVAEVRNGDVISVSAAQVIYVVGAVTKPGGYPMSDPSSGVSVVQAVALAEGLRSVASHHALIVRQSTNDRSRVEIPVDVGLMMSGKTTDVQLAPNDILFIPASGTKQTLKVLGDVAMAAATGVAIYGLGYRAAGVTP